MSDAFAIIPARGGSKRLPRKNVIDFLGRPIIAYTIEAALQSDLFAEVVVSTEDAEIATVAAKYGAKVDRRRCDLARDESTVVEVCIDYLDREVAARRNWRTMTCLYATAPLRNADDICSTMALLDPHNCSFAMAVTTYEHYPHQALQLAADRTLLPMWPDLVNRRASDLPVLRACNGSTYAVDVAEFRHARTFYGPRLKGYDMPRHRSIDIDTQEDLDLALWLARKNGFSKAN
jgi:pseudaminic acid cytidylyltransferase